MQVLYAAFVGLVFGAGILISGMADPNKVLNFFDFAGTWDPSLAFVMGGGLLLNLVGYWLVFKRQKPLLTSAFPGKPNAKIDGALIGGSALFGIGWGIAGFCPGAALPALGTFSLFPFVFVAAVAVGIIGVQLSTKVLFGGTVAKAK